MRKILLRFLLLSAVSSATTEICSAQVKIIPVVFHILHEGGTENISDAQVRDAVRILNEDYNKRNADTANVCAAFKNNIANMEVEFRLAGKDPLGSCTNGIERIYGSLSNSIIGNSDYVKIHQWSPDKYLNIWVTGKIKNGVSGYTYKPVSADTLPEFDGIIMLNNYTGSIGTSTLYTSRALTHEVGHYFNLLHTFTGCGGSDSVNDTPPTSGSGNCDTSRSVCNPPVIENVQNFMEYGYCSCMFTNGQKGRVHDCLNRSIANRNNLWTNANLIATGTNTLNPPPCAPICDFGASSFFVCEGTPVTFADNSYNGIVISRQWAFQNANISSSTDSSVTVIFNQVGWHTVSLSVSNAQGSSSKTKTMVFVGDTTSFVAPYFNGFEDGNEFAQNWASINPDNDQSSFQRVNSSSYNGSYSISVNNFGTTTDGTYNELVTPAFDLTALSNYDLRLNFMYSCASQSFTSSDSLVVYANKSCGTWVKIYSASHNPLVNMGVALSSFSPSNSAYWQSFSTYIPTAFRASNVHFKFRLWGMHDSNNFFLDNFSIGALPTGILESAIAIPQFLISPNPATTSITISIDETMLGSTATITDVTGRKMAAVPLSTVNCQLSTESFSSGVYFVTLTASDGRSATKKLAIQN